MNKNIGKNIGKNVSSKCSQKLLYHAKECPTDALKLLQKKLFKKHQKQLVIWSVIKLLIELQKTRELHRKIVQRQMNVKQKYLNKDISPERRHKILLMI